MSLFCYIILFNIGLYTALFNQSVIITPWHMPPSASHETASTAFNHKIYSISWGLTCGTCCIWNSFTQFSWNSDSITLGSCTASGGMCRAINLASDEYINGYRMYFRKNRNMKGLWFTSSYSTLYKCGPNSNVGSGYEYDTETGWILYDQYYLSGFQWLSGHSLDQIRFQFTSITDHYNCISSSTATDPVFLGQGSIIYSPDGASWLSIREYNAEMCFYTLVSTHCLHYNDTHQMWNTEESNYANKYMYAAIQSDGNFIYKSDSYSVWDTKTSTIHTPAMLCVKNGAILSLKDSNGDELWSMHFSIPSESPTKNPTLGPSKQPSLSPSRAPSNAPIKSPTKARDGAVREMKSTQTTETDEMYMDGNKYTEKKSNWRIYIVIIIWVLAIMLICLLCTFIKKFAKSLRYFFNQRNATSSTADADASCIEAEIVDNAQHHQTNIVREEIVTEERNEGEVAAAIQTAGNVNNINCAFDVLHAVSDMIVHGDDDDMIQSVNTPASAPIGLNHDVNSDSLMFVKKQNKSAIMGMVVDTHGNDYK